MMSEKLGKAKAEERAGRSPRMRTDISRDEKRSGRRIAPIEGEEIKLLVKALRIAGTAEKLAEWVKTPVPSLGGRTPYAAMQSAEGRKDVAAVLTRIEHGVY